MEPEQGMEYGITVNISADEGEKAHQILQDL